MFSFAAHNLLPVRFQLRQVMRYIYQHSLMDTFTGCAAGATDTTENEQKTDKNIAWTRRFNGPDANMLDDYFGCRIPKLLA